MKSAYEIALERLEKQGVSPPRSESLAHETKVAMAEVRAKAEASIAELEILYRDRLKKTSDPVKSAEEEQNYLEERRRIEERRDREIERLRSSS